MFTSIFVSVTFYLLAYYLAMEGKFHRQINSFTYLFITCVHTNFFIIMGEDFEIISITLDVDKYIAFLVARNIMVGLLVMIGVHLFFRKKSIFNRVVMSLLSVGSLYLLGIICRMFDFYRWEDWNPLWPLLYYTVLYVLGILSVLGTGRLLHKEGRPAK